MQQREISPAIVVGCVVAAATTGALVAMGRRIGSVGLPFASIAGMLVHPVVFGATKVAVASGLVLHLVLVFLWSALAVVLARGFRRRGLAALLTATTQFIVSWIVAWQSGNGLASVLALGDRLVYSVVLASALVVGMRFAFAGPRSPRPHAGAL